MLQRGPKYFIFSDNDCVLSLSCNRKIATIYACNYVWRWFRLLPKRGKRRDVPSTLTTLRVPFMSTSNSLWRNTTQVHPIPVISPQIAWLQDKHENVFPRRKANPEGSAQRKLWLSRVNKSACVRTLPCHKCFVILNQQGTEKKIVLHPN
jgi:hypothetical protein